MGRARLCDESGHGSVAEVEPRRFAPCSGIDSPGRIFADELLREMAGGTGRSDCKKRTGDVRRNRERKADDGLRESGSSVKCGPSDGPSCNGWACGAERACACAV